MNENEKQNFDCLICVQEFRKALWEKKSWQLGENCGSARDYRDLVQSTRGWLHTEMKEKKQKLRQCVTQRSPVNQHRRHDKHSQPINQGERIDS
jgi:hypothetical protein